MTDQGGDTIWWYNPETGIYENIGIPRLEQSLQDHLTEDLDKSKIKETIKQIQIMTYTDPATFRENPNIIVLQNGAYNLALDLFTPHSPKYNAKNRLPITYDPEARCPNIVTFLTQLLPNDIATVQEWIGYHLLKTYTYQKCFVLLGTGSNGKSTLLNLLTMFLGQENISARNLYELVTDKFSKADLHRKLANIAADIGSKELRYTGVFKALTGGDPISAQRKYRNPFKFYNYAKLDFSCNQLPVSPDESQAFFRRFMIFRFKTRFIDPELYNPESDQTLQPKDPKILEKITTQEELSGLFNWALQGLKRLQRNRQFTNSQTSTELKNQYTEMSDPITGFVNKHIIEQMEEWETKDDVYRAYYHFCKENGYVTIAKNKFSSELGARVYCRPGQRRIDDHRPTTWEGIKLVNVKGVKHVKAFTKKIQENPEKNLSNNTLDTFDTLDTYQKSGKTIQKRIREIEQAIKEGKTTPPEIAEYTGIPLEGVKLLLKKLEKNGGESY